MDGFRVVSSFDVDKFSCQNLESQVYQLAVILYPSELFNEKFLIRVRDCMLKLKEDHPVKKWLKAQAQSIKPGAQEQKKIDFITEMLNSQFNLITDQKVKTQAIALINEIPEETTLEKLLKSYLYLMIGNITRSDNILRSIIQTPPRGFYQGYNLRPSLYHRLTSEHLEKVMAKFSRHPADRLTFYLFNQYIKSYLNHQELLTLVDDLEVDEQDKVKLAYTYKIAPELVGFLRLSRMSEKRLMNNLRSKVYPIQMQSYWVWSFLNIDPLISEITLDHVRQLDQQDPLWAIYLLDNEKLADLYSRKVGIPVSRRRNFLRSHLSEKQDFMMTVYKLIELGDIDATLVNEVQQFMSHDH